MSKDKQLTCRCPAIKFPHRFMSGDCTGWSAVQEVWDKDLGCSRDCRYYSYNPGASDEPPSSDCYLLNHNKGRFPVECPHLDELVKEQKEKRQQ